MMSGRDRELIVITEPFDAKATIDHVIDMRS